MNTRRSLLGGLVAGVCGIVLPRVAKSTTRGGIVPAGPHVFTTGDNGKPEMIIPIRDMVVRGAPSGSEPLTIHVHLDGREISRVVAKRLKIAGEVSK